MTTRRDFLKHSALGAAGLTIGGLGFSSESYAGIMGANKKIRVGIVGFSDRTRRLCRCNNLFFHVPLPSYQSSFS